MLDFVAGRTIVRTDLDESGGHTSFAVDGVGKSIAVSRKMYLLGGCPKGRPLRATPRAVP